MALKPQNKTHAVMAQRFETNDSPDDFPTPPWATRALFEHILGSGTKFKALSCLEPACGAGHMSKVLEEYFGTVTSSDAFYYGYGDIKDFCVDYRCNEKFDWIITNPPFRLAEEFVLKALERAKYGVAILARTVFIESVGRYNNLFLPYPPTYFVQFSERVPMVKGRLDARATTATGYCWLIWEKNSSHSACLKWIPQCRKLLERKSDYGAPLPRQTKPTKTHNLVDIGSQFTLKI